jgi:ubiquinone/menaquinone biosynthesis C-methylase UbiE
MLAPHAPAVKRPGFVWCDVRMVSYDDELRAQHARLMSAAAVRAGERVLDVGCGAGQTTREAARAAAPGEVLGIDVSAAALERARELARELAAADGFANAAFEHGDAQTHAFAPGSFDVAISRFGLMFFADPAAAFANIARALRPGGRLVAIVWQRGGDNEWAVAIDEALGTGTAEHVGAFSLADADATKALLERAGFDDVRFEDVDEPVFYGPDVAAALDWVRSFQDVSDALASLEPDARDRALERLSALLAAHHRADRGVVFASRTWLITARRA